MSTALIKVRNLKVGDVVVFPVGETGSRRFTVRKNEALGRDYFQVHWDNGDNLVLRGQTEVQVRLLLQKEA